MNHQFETSAADSGSLFDPRQAALLLAQTTRQARRQFEPSPPWLLATRAVVALGVYGSIWLSVRGQHPYQHPTAAAIPGAVAFGVANLVATIAVAQRASAGIAGSPRLRPPVIAAMGAVWVGVFVVMSMLISAGASNAIVYGLYPATAPLIIASLIWAAVMAVRADWRACRNRSRSGHRRSCGHRGRPSRRVAGCRRGRVRVAPRARRRDPLAPATMSVSTSHEALDPLIHVPTRLRIVATLATLPPGDTLSFTRLQDMIRLTPGNLIIHLRKLEEAGYLTSEKTRNNGATKTTVTLTSQGRAALAAYTQQLRDLLGDL